MVFDSQSLMAVKVIKDQPLTTNSNQPQEISRWIRYVLPAHYLMKVESYSLLSMSSGKILTFYPNGDKRFDTNNDYVSLYLTISESNVLPKGWEVNVNFILFVYNHITGICISIQKLRIGLEKAGVFRTLCYLKIFTNLQMY
ncbi:hypothetical protein F8388_012034 [Cannabis sativa]|uniref:Uncharacterized protein n=1 Tax=Cannabis sativa TaxID=3483 RepID=A0A7J6GE66_CANSA|nr:hypothetical protein F8388_012034 [Cannabis sativa]